jgi:hypothetical protein
MLQCNTSGLRQVCRETPIYHSLLTVRLGVAKGPEPQV